VKGIVADSSPLIVLARSGLIPVLRRLANEVFVPATVMAECSADGSKPGAQAIRQACDAALIDVRPDFDRRWPGGPPVALDAGELAAIAMAGELGCPVLMDERLGRQVARLHGVSVMGGAGILLAAKSRGFVPAVAPILTEWKRWGYFLSSELLAAVLARAGEQPG